MFQISFLWLWLMANNWGELWMQIKVNNAQSLQAASRESKIAQRKRRLPKKKSGKTEKTNKKVHHKDKNLSVRKWRHEWMNSWAKCMFDWMNVHWKCENAQKKGGRFIRIFPNHARIYVFIFIFTCDSAANSSVKKLTGKLR